MDSPPQKRRTIKINPDEYLGSWKYHIRPAHWPAVGISLREYIDKPKTKAARHRAMAAGTSKKDSLKIKIKYQAYVVTDPPDYDFHEGDIFYVDHYNDEDGLQISAIRDAIEVHRFDANGYLYACQLSSHGLAQWLETGREPDTARINPSQCWKESARYLLKKDGHLLPPQRIS